MPAHNAISKKDLIEDIKNVYKNKPIDIKFTMQFYIDHGKYSKTPIKKYGGWNAILTELGLDLNVHYDVSKEDIINDFLRVKQEYDSISCTTYRKYGKYNQIYIDRLFGGFSNLMKEIGITSMRNVRTLSDEELLKELKKLYHEYGYINSSLIAAKSKFTYQTVLNRFGYMSNVYALLGVNCDVNNKSFFNRANEAILIASKILKETPIQEWTCPSLVNPEKSSHLYVDAYFPIANIALEYDGIQHYEYVEYMHKTIEKFERTKMLDKHKENLLNEMGIKVVRIKYNDPIDENFIREKLS